MNKCNKCNSTLNEGEVKCQNCGYTEDNSDISQPPFILDAIKKGKKSFIRNLIILGCGFLIILIVIIIFVFA